jgi:hypothetical protein
MRNEADYDYGAHAESIHRMTAKNPPGPPMTLGNMHGLVVQYLITLLHECCQARHLEPTFSLVGSRCGRSWLNCAFCSSLSEP